MMVQHLKRRPLSRYLKDFKHSQTHCAHCRKLLDRITLVRDAVPGLISVCSKRNCLKPIISKKSLCVLQCKSPQNRHNAAHDFCSVCQPFSSSSVSRREISILFTILLREYVVRLRRLGNHLHEQNISLDQLQDGFLDEILAPWLPTTSTNNYRIALRKYQHYQRQTCTRLVQKSSSLPSSDIY